MNKYLKCQYIFDIFIYIILIHFKMQKNALFISREEGIP